jgi:pimeloyl-ACP methyl ester carboxylesterase
MVRESRKNLREGAVMSRAKARILGGIVVALVLLVVGDATAASTKIAWSKCFGEFQCGTLQVPLDYDQPNGTTISLAVVRLPATDPAHRIGSLLLNPGGPGGSGVDYTVFAGPELYTPEVRARFDLVGFDPRGIARSTALRCFGTTKQAVSVFPPFLFPMTRAELAQWIASDRRLVDACDQRGGRIADHMATADVARDMDSLRAALGDAQLTYAGVSYGSYLGVTYANMFPSRVRAIVVDGVLDPIAWSTGRTGEAATLPFSTRLHSDLGAQATLNEFFRLCDAGGSRCPFSGGAAARYAALAQRLLQQPITVTFPDGTSAVLDYSNLIGFTLGAMYDSSSWPDFAAMLADIEHQATAQQIGLRAERFRGPALYIPKRGFPHYLNFAEGFPAVACADSDNPDSYEAWWNAGIAADAANGYFGRIWTWASGICASWDHTDADRYMGPFDKRTSNPVLVVGNQFDPATPYHGAVTVANLLPNSALLTVHGWGHTSLFLSACADETITRYLVDLTTPPPGTVCQQDDVPFSP